MDSDRCGAQSCCVVVEMLVGSVEVGFRLGFALLRCLRKELLPTTARAPACHANPASPRSWPLGVTLAAKPESRDKVIA